MPTDLRRAAETGPRFFIGAGPLHHRLASHRCRQVDLVKLRRALPLLTKNASPSRARPAVRRGIERPIAQGMGEGAVVPAPPASTPPLGRAAPSATHSRLSG